MDRFAMQRSALDDGQIRERMDAARYMSRTFQEVGAELHVLGHILGTDRRDGISPSGHGNDATVAISMLLRIASELVSGSAELIHAGQHYAGAALVRQLVEVEYLAWAFETNNRDAAAWLRSDKQERMGFFTPAKLRAAAGSHFRSKDYGFHCECGGHPAPGSWMLLNGDVAVAQLMLSDCIGHAGQVWNHVVGWAQVRENGAPVQARSRGMAERHSAWMAIDQLTTLPPPPL